MAERTQSRCSVKTLLLVFLQLCQIDKTCQQYQSHYGSGYWQNDGNQPYGSYASPYGSSSYSYYGNPSYSSPYYNGGSPYGGSSYGSSPYSPYYSGGSPYGRSPYSTYSNGDSPYGRSPYSPYYSGGSPYEGGSFYESFYPGQYAFPELYFDHDDLYNDSTVSTYDSRTERCCGGKVSSLLSQYRACCGSSDYDTAHQVCCSGKVHDMKPGFRCCGPKFFNVNEAICCEPVLVPLDPKIPRDHAACCGTSSVYNHDTHVCCGRYGAFTVQEKKSPTTHSYGQLIDENCNDYSSYYTSHTLGQNYYPTGSYASSSRPYGIHSSSWDRCGSKLYNGVTHICCHSNGAYAAVERVAISTDCCGLGAYNSQLEICCEGKLYTKSDETISECCGDQLFDPSKQICCEGTKTVADAKVGSNSCCGKAALPFDSLKQVCCGDQVLDLQQGAEPHYSVCCRSQDGTTLPKLYNAYTEMCCDGEVYKLTGGYKTCCGNKLADGYTSTCCNGEVLPASGPTLCCNGTAQYDSNTQMCCGGHVVAKSSPEQICCGKVTYDWQKEICCLDSDTDTYQVSPKAFYAWGCCGSTVYDQTTHFCCGSTLVATVAEERNTCCRQYNVATGNMEYQSSKVIPNGRCCGLKVYDATQQLCCNLTVVDKNGESDVACCGSQVYNLNSQICCYGETREKGTPNSWCCGKKVFDPDTEVCCRGVVKTIVANKNNDCCYPEDLGRISG